MAVRVNRSGIDEVVTLVCFVLKARELGEYGANVTTAYVLPQDLHQSWVVLQVCAPRLSVTLRVLGSHPMGPVWVFVMLTHGGSA